MSGHSKWSTIKHQKGAEDKKRGQLFSKLSRAIVLAAKKGPDPTSNASLRLAIEQAKRFNLPKENVERAIAKGSGKESGGSLEEFVFEAYGPGGTALIIEGITDNQNRSVGHVKDILKQYGGKFAEGGSVQWMFEQRGVARLELASNQGQSKEALMESAIDANAQDIQEEDENTLVAIFPKETLMQGAGILAAKGIVIAAQGLEWLPKQEVALEDQSARETFQKLVEALNENEDVQNIYSNLAER